MTDTKHTALPWNKDSMDSIYGLTRRIADVICNDPEDEETCEANAEFIVRACNSHYELLEALKAVVNYTGDDWKGDNIHDQIRDAIKRAEGK